MRYCTWEDVKREFKLADQVVPVVLDRERLLDEMTGIFRSYTRNVRHAALTASGVGEYEALAREVVMSLVVGKLERRAKATSVDLREMDFGFMSGSFTEHEITAYTHIAAIKSGDAVFEEDPALRDVVLPETISEATNTSQGLVIASLPVGYKAHVPGVYRIMCTTAGRVDDGTARFRVYFQNNLQLPEVDGLVPTTFPQHIRNELYLSFRDKVVAGNSFVAADTWTVTAYPADTAARANGPKEINLSLS